MIDLTKCKPGDKLRIRFEGVVGELLKEKGITSIATYGRYIKSPLFGKEYHHEIIYSDGSKGTRADNGQTYVNNPHDDDPDVLEIL